MVFVKKLRMFTGLLSPKISSFSAAFQASPAGRGLPISPGCPQVGEIERELHDPSYRNPGQAGGSAGATAIELVALAPSGLRRGLLLPTGNSQQRLEVIDLAVVAGEDGGDAVGPVHRLVLLTSRPCCRLPLPPGEWPGGISPPGSRRTARDSLPSYGSHHPVSGSSQPPVGKELRLTCEHVRQELPGPSTATSQSLVLLHRPAHQVPFDAPE